MDTAYIWPKLKPVWLDSYLDLIQWDISDLANATGIAVATFKSWYAGGSVQPSRARKVLKSLNSKYRKVGIKVIVSKTDILETNRDTRRNKMLSMRAVGMTLNDIGQEFGISKQRVNQIVGVWQPNDRKCLCCDNLFSPKLPSSVYCNQQCGKAYRKYGGLPPTELEKTIKRLEKITKNIAPPNDNGCWEWQGHCNPSTGYGQVYYYGRSLSAHRFMWMAVYGDIPDSLFVLHKCDNPPCVNPKHLYLGTAKDNAADRDSRNRHQSNILSKSDIKTIRSLYSTTNDCKHLSKQFNVHPKTIYDIAKGKTRIS